MFTASAQVQATLERMRAQAAQAARAAQAAQDAQVREQEEADAQARAQAQTAVGCASTCGSSLQPTPTVEAVEVASSERILACPSDIGS